MSQKHHHNPNAFCPFMDKCCEEHGCVWWDADTKNCVIWTIRDSLRQLVSKQAKEAMK